MSIPYKGRKKVTKPFVSKDGIVFEHYTQEDANNFSPDEFNIIKQSYSGGVKDTDEVKRTIKSESELYLDDIIKVTSEPLKVAATTGKNIANAGIELTNIADKTASEGFNYLGLGIKHEDIPKMELPKNMAPASPGGKLVSDLLPYAISGQGKLATKTVNTVSDIIKTSPRIAKALGLETKCGKAIAKAVGKTSEVVAKEASSTAVGSTTYAVANDKDIGKELAIDTGIGMATRGVISPIANFVNKRKDIASNIKDAYTKEVAHTSEVEVLLQQNKIAENLENSIIKKLPESAVIKPDVKAGIEALTGIKDFNTVGELKHSLDLFKTQVPKEISAKMKSAPLPVDDIYKASKASREATVLSPSLAVDKLPEGAVKVMGASPVTQLASSIGSLGEKTLPFGMATSVRSKGQDIAISELNKVPLENLKVTRGYAEESLLTAKKNNNTTAIKDAEHQLKDLDVVENSLATGKELSQSELSSLYQGHLSSKNYDSKAPTPLENYFSGKNTVDAVKGAKVDSIDNSAIGTAVIGYLTGGVSTAVQAGAYAGKRILDKSVTKRFERVLEDVKAYGDNADYINRAQDLARSGDTAGAVEAISKLDTTSMKYLGESLKDVAETSAQVANIPLRGSESVSEALTEASSPITEPETNYTDVNGGDLGKVEWEDEYEAVPEGVMDEIQWEAVPEEALNDIQWEDEVVSDDTHTNPKPIGKMYKHSPSTDRMYHAISMAETGSMKDRYMRTMAKDKKAELHSSAYGPAQLTYSTAQGYLKRYPQLFNKEERAYLVKFVDQGKKFIKHSKGEFQGDEKVWGYGGTGVLTSSKDRVLYEAVTKKMMGQVIKDKGTTSGVLTAWRGDKMDRAYNKIVKKHYQSYDA